MEVNLNIPDWLKIPLNVLLPALWLFSGILLLLPDEWLNTIYLLDWKNENGFTIGLVFVVTSCLLFVYLFLFLKKTIMAITYNLTYKRKTIKEIYEMNDIEVGIIFNLYNCPGYTCELDYNQPIVQGLLRRNYIHMGGQQHVTLDVFTNSIPMRFTLQPFVYKTLDHYKYKMEKYIAKIEMRVNTTNDVMKKKRLSSKLTELREQYEYIYGER